MQEEGRSYRCLKIINQIRDRANQFGVVPEVEILVKIWVAPLRPGLVVKDWDKYKEKTRVSSGDKE